MMNEENQEVIREHLSELDAQLDEIVDSMIERYGKFIDLQDIQGKDYQDKRYLYSRYQNILDEKRRLNSQLYLGL